VAGGAVAGLVRRTAEQDGRGVEVAVEQEPGATGKIAAAYIARELAGWNVRTVAPQGDKLTRAMPLLAQAESGHVAIVRAAWNAALLDELASFPGGPHDDQVDAAAHAFGRLCGGGSSVLI
jgi:predicted phage terminase large subunit-like protein